MRTIRKSLPSPAMIVACAALVLALGGVSYAAAVLPESSVGTVQLKKKAVTAPKLRANSVSGAKVKDRTLTAIDFQAGQLPQGPKGDPGAQGPKGDAGAPGISGREYVIGAEVSVNPGQIGGAQVTCPAGKKVMGGGGGTEGNAPIVAIGQINDSTWAVNIRNNEGVPAQVSANAVCAQVG
jgi:hypothetical protein